ncbi:MAG: metal ABC transporter substrate-binding protein [Candidatus Micrarchaeota archaeon]|nr:metal ABC transporter substrate-binding protein [Candidatus Micrarchaeota archaeon]
MKSGIAIIFVVGLLLFGCTAQPQPQNSGKLKVVASFYPMYDFAKNVGGDRVEVTSLIPAGVEPHDFEPTPSDIKTLSSARVLVLNGVIEDTWAPKLLEGIDNPNLTVVDASKGVQLVASEDADMPGNDPHIWLDPVDAKIQVANIRDALEKADPAGKDYYEADANAYMAKLDKLDAEFRATMAICKNKNMIITHATLAYFCKEYGCNQVPVEGVNAEGEPTPVVVAAIVDQAKAKNITVVFVEKLYSPKVAQTIASEIGGKVAVFNTLHGLTPEEQQRGEDYLSQQEENVATIKANLDCG